MKIKFNIKKFVKPSWILTVLVIVIFIYEAYLLYNKVYGNLSTNVDYVATGSIVRLDLDAYYKTIDLFDQYRNYQPPIRSLINSNPFR